VQSIPDCLPPKKATLGQSELMKSVWFGTTVHIYIPQGSYQAKCVRSGAKCARVQNAYLRNEPQAARHVQGVAGFDGLGVGPKRCWRLVCLHHFFQGRCKDTVSCVSPFR
jgi:hypothetical protein